MKLFSAKQIRDWDQYTMAHEPIASYALIERAAAACANWISHHLDSNAAYHIFCGKGNNGGDGLVIARDLFLLNKKVVVYILEHSAEASDDFTYWRKQLPAHLEVLYITEDSITWPELNENSIIVDALFGSGLNRPLEGWLAEFVSHLNAQKVYTLSIDVPSGLPVDFCEAELYNHRVVVADMTLTFQVPKLSLLLPDTGKYTQSFEVLNIGLHSNYTAITSTPYYYNDLHEVCKIWRPQEKFTHKRKRGHALLLCGSRGMTGAAILSAKACLHSGAGLCSVHLPESERTALHTSLPEALWLEILETDMSKYDALACGCGVGQTSYGVALVDWVLQQNIPTVLDADALNIIAAQKWLPRLVPNIILTPHVKEFERLGGLTRSTAKDRLERQIQVAQETQCIIVLKGAHTSIALPNGEVYFNSTGHPILATAGSGDVLTGIITALLAQGYPPAAAATFGVYIHGAAGDKLATQKKYILAHEIAEEIPFYLNRQFL